jgi:hypothetical protein
MAEKLSDDFIVRFDAALDNHMATAFAADPSTTGVLAQNWRHRCHQSAKIAARSIGILLNCKTELVRVQLRAMMDGSPQYVDLGNPDDPPTAARRYSMHWAVRIGSSLYDPTALWQLRSAKTPLSLPPYPYFFFEDFFKLAAPSPDGGLTVAFKGPEGKLYLDYKLIPVPLPPAIIAQMLPDGEVRRHAREVAKLFV